MRQWLCCVVLRNVGLWLIFVAIIRTYPYPRIRKKKKKRDGTNRNTKRWSNNDTRVSHTHTHTYIYIRVYICRLCDVFQSGESNPLRRIANESMKSKYDLPQNIESLILFHRMSYFSFFFFFKKSNNYVLSGEAWKEGASSKLVESHQERSSLQSKVIDFCESKLSRISRNFAILILQLRKHEDQSSW